jgi:hypothetical protein
MWGQYTLVDIYRTSVMMYGTMQCLRRLVATLSPRRTGFNSKPVHVTVDKVGLEYVFFSENGSFSLSVS